MANDPLSPHINSDGKAFNGNYKAVGIAVVLLAIGAVALIGSLVFG